MEKEPVSKGCMCLEPCKYLGFNDISLLSFGCYFVVLMVGFGSHFDEFWCTLGVVFLVFEGPWDLLEFGCIWGSSLDRGNPVRGGLKCVPGVQLTASNTSLLTCKRRQEDLRQVNQQTSRPET